MAPRERSGLSLRWEFVPGIEGTDRFTSISLEYAF